MRFLFIFIILTYVSPSPYFRDSPTVSALLTQEWYTTSGISKQNEWMSPRSEYTVQQWSIWDTPETPRNDRQVRKIICNEEYQKFKNQITNPDLIVERCATMLEIQYKFESGHWKSRNCRIQHNCQWIKNNKRERCVKSKNWYCTYFSEEEWMRDYAEMFMKHYEKYKNLTEYLHVYCPDGNWAYPDFVKSKYSEVLAYFTKK